MVMKIATLTLMFIITNRPPDPVLFHSTGFKVEYDP